MSKINFLKSKFIPTAPLMFISLEFYLGLIFGYLLTKVLAGKKPGEQGFIKSLIFNIGSWRVHLHHWLIGAAILVSGVIFSFLSYTSFSFGFIGGMVYQGVRDYPDWPKIIAKKSNNI